MAGIDDGFLNFDEIVTGIEAAELGIESAEDFFDMDSDDNQSSFVKSAIKNTSYGRRELEFNSFDDWSYYGDEDR